MTESWMTPELGYLRPCSDTLESLRLAAWGTVAALAAKIAGRTSVITGP
jgi:hypothetical protein